MTLTHHLLPPAWPVDSDWTPRVGHIFQTRTGQALLGFVAAERNQFMVFPEAGDVFNAFRLTSFAGTQVVILGQDPYHGAGQAHGLSFSVPDGIKHPPSLRNIFRELAHETDMPQPDSGNLESWARQGVLLLNTVLTVREGQAGSHRGQGWETFTDCVIQELDKHPEPLVFVLWGKSANEKAAFIDSRHELVVSPHPSPLSAHRGFTGSRPFSQINTALRKFGREEIRWQTVCESTSNQQ